jgi:hypothetical protein
LFFTLSPTADAVGYSLSPLRGFRWVSPPRVHNGRIFQSACRKAARNAAPITALLETSMRSTRQFVTSAAVTVNDHHAQALGAGIESEE